MELFVIIIFLSGFYITLAQAKTSINETEILTQKVTSLKNLIMGNITQDHHDAGDINTNDNYTNIQSGSSDLAETVKENREFKTGVCFKELDHSSLVNNHINITRKEVCCEGYIRVNESCQAFCSLGCNKGHCIAPDTCECPNSYKLDSTGFNCIPQCDPPCLNGFCESPNLCVCNPGYKLEGTTINDVAYKICRRPCHGLTVYTRVYIPALGLNCSAT